MNNDDLLDIVIGNTGQQNAVFFNQGSGTTFREVRFGEASEVTYNLAVGDLNKDGYTDIAVANSGSENRIYINLPAKK